MKITLLALLFSALCYPQFQNSAEKEVFSIDNADISKFEFSGGETALEYNFFHWEQKYRLKKPAGTVVEPTSQKFNGLTFKIGLTDAEKFINLNDFKLSKQGWLFGFNYIHSAKEIMKAPSASDYFNMWTFKFGVEFKFDKIESYDPARYSVVHEKPTTISLSGSATRYWFHFDHKLTLAFSVNGSYQPKTYNSTGLTNFKELGTDVTSSENVVAFKDFDGKFGRIDNSVSAGNLAISFPVFVDYKPTKFYPYVVPLPYVSVNALSTDKPRFHTGFGLGFFPKAIFELPDKEEGTSTDRTKSIAFKTINDQGVKETAVAKKITRKFNSPSFLSFGMDWTFQGPRKSHPHYFVTGTITFE